MTIGIYAICNKINGKKYVGKSKHIEHRISSHFCALRKQERDKKKTNRHLFNSFKKYGEDAFYWEILEAFDNVDEALLKERELHYMQLLKTTERDFGYNLRMDSSTNMIVHEETKRLQSEQNTGTSNPNFGNKWSDEQKQNMSKIKKKQFEDGVYDFMKTDEHRKFLSEFSTNLWKDEGKKAAMAEKVSLAKSELRFYQYCKVTGELLNVWESIADILKANPDYHRIAIYSVCNGHKKSYRGYVWKSEKKCIEIIPE